MHFTPMTNIRTTKNYIKGCLLCVVTIILWIFMCIVVVPAGHVGVVNYFGSVYDHHLPPGISFVNPFSNIIKLSTRMQVLPYERSVLSSEGLTIDIVLALQYSIDTERVVKLYKSIGENYKDVIIVPVLSSIIREVTSKRDAKAMYTSETRMEMHKEMREGVTESLRDKGIIIHDVLLRDVILPQKLKDAIENKLDMEQQAERMKFVLSKERQEAERKEIEANGIQKFQEIVSKGIDEHLLQWKGIEATLHLAESQNTKIVVIGNSEHGLPIIFDDKK